MTTLVTLLDIACGRPIPPSDSGPARRRELVIIAFIASLVFAAAWGLAELYEAQDVIDPRDTRDYLIRTLEVHRMRMKNGVGEHLLRNWPTSY